MLGKTFNAVVYVYYVISTSAYNQYFALTLTYN